MELTKTNTPILWRKPNVRKTTPMPRTSHFPPPLQMMMTFMDSRCTFVNKWIPCEVGWWWSDFRGVLRGPMKIKATRRWPPRQLCEQTSQTTCGATFTSQLGPESATILSEPSTVHFLVSLLGNFAHNKSTQSELNVIDCFICVMEKWSWKIVLPGGPALKNRLFTVVAMFRSTHGSTPVQQDDDDDGDDGDEQYRLVMNAIELYCCQWLVTEMC